MNAPYAKTVFLISLLLFAEGTSAAPYEGWWSQSRVDCANPERFIKSGRTIIIQGVSIKAFDKECELKNVIGTERDNFDVQCLEEKGTSRLTLRIARNGNHLKITRPNYKKYSFLKCSALTREYLRQEPKDFAIALEDKGEYFLANHDYVKAEEFFSRSIRADPKYASAYNNRGYTRRLVDRYHEAIADYDEAIRIEPYQSVYYSNRGVVRDILNQNVEALADFNQSLKIDPKGQTALCGRGKIYRKIGRLDDAIRDLSAAIEYNPRYVIALVALGLAWKDKGNVEKSRAIFQKVITIDPSNTDAKQYLGTI